MNANTFFDPIKAEAFEWINAGLDSLVIPIGALICGAVFIFLLIKCVAEYRAGQGEDIKNKIFSHATMLDYCRSFAFQKSLVGCLYKRDLRS